MFNVVESEIVLPYRIGHSYYEHGNDLRKVGDRQMGFSNADIVSIHNYGFHDDHQTIKFYKEFDFIQPSHIRFTIFSEQENLILTELHVHLAEKRSYWRENRETRGRGFSNFSLVLKIIQDPNKKIYQWTGEYFG